MALARLQQARVGVGLFDWLTLARPKRAALTDSRSCVTGFAAIDDMLALETAVGKQGLETQMNTDEHR
jgi:hypothetical protein